MTVMLGSNRFTDCQNLLGISDRTVLKIEVAPLRVTLRTPSGLPSGIHFAVEHNVEDERVGTVHTGLRVVADAKSAAIFWNDAWLIAAAEVDENTVNLHVDLRPIGINIYDDPQGLHVGTNVLARNSFSNCATAIALA